MTDPAVRVDVARFTEGLDLDLQRMEQEIRLEVRRIAVEMRGYARQNAPVRKPTRNKAGKMVSHTAGLRTSITSQVVDDDDGLTAVVGTNRTYGPYVEFGTGDRGMAANGGNYKGHQAEVSYTAGWPGMVPQSYLRPALYDKETEFVGKIDQAVRRSIR
ncbi:MAG: HK97 gp10 family phage protein [Candidatus Methanomethylophilaceae archaeon]|nr:HK97 gp10 family phage protein [Candidatus Methanomethylophilaceae archaeon]